MAHLSEAQNAVRWLIIMRVGVTTLLLVPVGGVYLWGHLPFPVLPFLGVVATSYLLTGPYWALTTRVRNPLRLAEVQIYLDVLLETALVYVTGGPYSVFAFIYLFSVLATSIVVAPRRSYATATAGVLLHGLLLVFQFHRLLPPVSHLAASRDIVVEGSLTILLIIANASASYTVAYLATYLAGRLRQVRWEARRTEASLAELQLLHEDIVQSVASGLVTFDRDGGVTTVNRTTEILCGASQEALRGKGWEQIFEQPPPFARAWATLTRPGQAPLRFEARLIGRDGSRIPVGVSVSLLRRGQGAICAFQDLTEIKQMEERIRHADRLAAIGRFAAGLAHEIRNPIASIRGSVEVLGESLNPQGDDRRLMEIVLRESDRLDGIIAEFLEFSRPGGLAKAEIDLVGLIEEILLLLAHQAPPGVRIARDYAEPTVKASVDPGKIRQALWNLCRNALEAMPQGGELRVFARGEAGDHGGGWVEIGVEDTGVGITAEQLPRLFEPFYTTKPHGTGLGLAIVHRIVEDHGGEIRVKSRPGTGTRITLLLPQKDG